MCRLNPPSWSNLYVLFSLLSPTFYQIIQAQCKNSENTKKENSFLCQIPLTSQLISSFLLLILAGAGSTFLWELTLSSHISRSPSSWLTTSISNAHLLSGPGTVDCLLQVCSVVQKCGVSIWNRGLGWQPLDQPGWGPISHLSFSLKKLTN